LPLYKGAERDSPEELQAGNKCANVLTWPKNWTEITKLKCVLKEINI
jgi:hypothetical protein